jgi:hypothetical protein
MIRTATYQEWLACPWRRDRIDNPLPTPDWHFYEIGFD